MEIIGVLGGVASGKSAVARMFESLGAVRLDADQVGHAVLQEPEVRALLRKRWGAVIFDDEGQLSRPAIARIVFAAKEKSAAELRFLEATTHPRIAAHLETELSRAAARGDKAVVLDAALLLEVGWDRLCTRLVFVEVSPSERIRRARQRGWTDAEFASREAAQWPLAKKRARAETIIDNSGPLEETLEQVKAVWSTWKVDRD